MKVIEFKIDVRLNRDDKLPTQIPTYLSDTPRNREYAKKVSVDGTFKKKEIYDV